MAALLKAPSHGAKGVLVVTDRERDSFVTGNRRVRGAIEGLKGRWMVGLHHNWQDFEFEHDPLFDFSMAGEEDLIEVHGRPFAHIPLDAANFVPTAFRPGGDKFWDILFVGRSVFFKKIPEFLDAVRVLYDAGRRYRVLAISPIPPYERKQRKTVLYDIRERYLAMFDEAEQNLFNLMAFTFRYPFPFDRETLAHFYRSSRVLVHPANDERRPRTVAYAWASGLPVVAGNSVASLLPAELRKEPWLFRADSDGRSIADRIPDALAAADAAHAGADAVRGSFDAERVVTELDRRLHDIAGGLGFECARSPIAASELDIRIARHHGFGDHANSIPTPLANLIDVLRTRSDEDLQRDLEYDDPERRLQAQM